MFSIASVTFRHAPIMRKYEFIVALRAVASFARKVSSSFLFSTCTCTRDFDPAGWFISGLSDFAMESANRRELS